MKNNERFLRVFTEGSEFGTKREIFVDRETGVQYLFVKSGYGAGLTPLLDRDGKPMVKTVFNDMDVE